MSRLLEIEKEDRDTEELEQKNVEEEKKLPSTKRLLVKELELANEIEKLTLDQHRRTKYIMFNGNAIQRL